VVSSLLKGQIHLQQISTGMLKAKREFDISVSVVQGSIVKSFRIYCAFAIDGDEIAKEDINISRTFIVNAAPLVI
jgi:hypothetical protein